MDQVQQRGKTLLLIGIQKIIASFQIDFYPPPQFENCGGHREPKFYAGYPGGVYKLCAAIFHILCNFENMGL